MCCAGRSGRARQRVRARRTGRLHAAAGQPELALAYYQRALTIDPAAAAARNKLQAIQRARAHRIQLGFPPALQRRRPAPIPEAGFGSVNFRATDVFARPGQWTCSASLAERDPGRAAGRRVAGGAVVPVSRGASFGGTWCCRRAMVTAESTTGRAARPGASTCGSPSSKTPTSELAAPGSRFRLSRDITAPGEPPPTSRRTTTPVSRTSCTPGYSLCRAVLNPLAARRRVHAWSLLGSRP